MTKTSQLRTVMICDDEQDVLLTYAEMLRADYSIITTSSGKQCIKTYTEKKNSGQIIHVILLDFKLGDMSGDEVAKTIMALNGTSIILISAYEIEPELIDKLK